MYVHTYNYMYVHTYNYMYVSIYKAFRKMSNEICSDILHALAILVGHRVRSKYPMPTIILCSGVENTTKNDLAARTHQEI